MVVLVCISQRQHYTFAAGDEGGVVIKSMVESTRDYAWEADSVAELLGMCRCCGPC